MENKLKSRDITEALKNISKNFGKSARETILFENQGKHLLEIGLILEMIGDGNSILDIGGGLGINLLTIKQLSGKKEMNQKDFKLYLVDKFEEYDKDNRMGEDSLALEMMGKSNIEVVKQDFWDNYQLPFESNSFDLVTILNVTEHLPGNPLKILEEIKRILKPKGIIIHAGPNAFSLMKRIRFLRGKHPHIPFELWMKEKYYSHYREYGVKESKLLLEKAGFSVNKVICSVEPLKTQLIFRKRNFSFIKTVFMSIIYFIKLIFPNLRPSVYAVGINEKG